MAIEDITFQICTVNENCIPTLHEKSLEDLLSINEDWKYILSTENVRYARQQTPYKDINGKQIYSGDIVKAKCYPFYSDAPEMEDGKDNPVMLNYLGQVGIDDEGVYYDIKRVSDRVAGRATGGNLSEIVELVEVVGNFYESPELLEIVK